MKFLKKILNLKKLKNFFIYFYYFFFFHPATYFTLSLIDETKRTDYPGKEIARLVQNKWDDNFIQ